MEFNWELIEESKANHFYIYVMYEGGDADTEHPEEYDIPGVDATNYKLHIDKIKKELKKYKKLKELLNVNSPDYMDDYDEIRSVHGEELADMFDNVPNDPANDYQNKTSISYICFIKYDEEGNRYESEYY